MKRFNVCTCKTYQSNGQEKKFWPNVGSMIYFPANGEKKGGFKLELNMFPGTQFFIFEEKSKEAQKQVDEFETAPQNTATVNADDIPF